MTDDPTERITAALVGDNSPLNRHEADWVAAALAPVVDALRAEAAAVALLAAARQQRDEAEQVPWDDQGTHADGHRCAADFLDRFARAVRRDRTGMPNARPERGAGGSSSPAGGNDLGTPPPDAPEGAEGVSR
jgi:hypothetical protein